MTRLLTVLALASACAPRPPEPCVEPDAAWIDRDEDGFPEEWDCNDDHAGIHPEAFEECDRIDNNCNGEKDEIYLDYDDDGRPDCSSEELCDGIDNDLDGRVDEGFEDFDGDGVADCLDRSCETTTASSVDVDINEECSGPDITILDPWDVDIEWQFTVGSGRGVIQMPAIGNLSDDNGDGRIDLSDTPDIVFPTWGENKLMVLSGDGSGTVWSKSAINGNNAVAIADVDGDGDPEVIASTTGGDIVSFGPGGVEEWRTRTSPVSYAHPTVADLDGDGKPEVIYDTAVLDGATGKLLFTLGGLNTSWRTPVVADLDNDGTMEILLGENVYDHTGKLEWTVARTISFSSTFAAVADIDGDLGGESFWVYDQYMSIVDDDGTLIRRVTVPGATSRRLGPPAVADFDGDGDVEIAVPANNQIHVFETDGTLVWSQVMRDFSGIAGASGYDVDGDGAYEVLFADETHFRMYDGSTGKILYQNASHSSGTLFEYPSIADVDGDGSAEIVIGSNGSTWKGITVFGHKGSGWAEAGPAWPVHDFCVTNINPDLSVPTKPPPPWTVHNVFRARPVVDAVNTDIMVEITDVCVSSCEPGVGTLSLQAQVRNEGGQTTYVDMPVTLFAVDGAVLTPLQTIEVTGGVEGGRAARSIEFTVAIENVGVDGLLVRADDNGLDPEEERDGAFGRVSECDEDNNSDDWPYDVCGP